MGISALMESCATHYVHGTINENRVELSKKEFEALKKNEITYRKYIILKVEGRDFPFVIYRFSDNKYSAYQLRCTHQGAELSVNGDIISCSAHGSEFSNKGEVLQGPAEENLFSYPVAVLTDRITIEIQ